MNISHRIEVEEHEIEVLKSGRAGIIEGRLLIMNDWELAAVGGARIENVDEWIEEREKTIAILKKYEKEGIECVNCRSNNDCPEGTKCVQLTRNFSICKPI